MAKKAAVKKPRRRLKKTARRSLAAVLMITAIVVAAIPVPENLAVNPAARAEDPIVSPVAYIPADEKPANDKNALPAPPENKYVLPYTGDKKLPDGDDITTKEQLREYVLVPAVKDNKIQATEIVTTNGAAKYLTWQFIYQKTGTNRGKVLNYNDEFQMPLVDLGLQPNKSYFSVYKKAYDAYFDDPEQLILTEDVPVGKDKTLQLLDMTNLRRIENADGSVTYADFYPTQPVIYTADDYDDSTNMVMLPDKYKKFFENYFPTDYQNKTASFKSFWDEYKRLNSSDKQEDKDAAAEMLANKDSDPRLTPLERSPNQLDEVGRQKFFCDHNRVLQNSGYQLELVADDRLDAVEGTSVYVAHGGDISLISDYKEDANGYLVKEDTTILSTVAYRAFANVHNVDQIKIDAKVATIEQSAFEGANIKSVSLGNAAEIGARAFYNCINLTSVTFPEPANTTSIGVEAFCGSGINTKLEFPSYLTEIGYGAFAQCRNLGEVQFANGSGCTIGDFSFYDNLRLTKVDFSETVITKIGEAAFAIAAPSGDAMTDFHFPQARLRDLDDYVLANRRGLQNVYFDFYMGSVPVHTFYNCFGLKRAEFSDNSGAATFAPELFKDVTEESFCVYGPELYNNNPANPRTSTWDAVRTDGKGIPYVYEKDGKKYYEMALESEDGTRYRYAASEDGTLISCALITRSPGLVDLVIPEKIGNIQIKSIGTGCFNEADPTNPLRAVIRSITIKNNSVSSIGDGVFRDLPKLKKVRIGDSVTSIGANAFAGCSILEHVYFTKPAAGYAALRIGTDAFVTKGSRLTFHGDIVEGYAPFEWATDESNLLRDPDKPNLPPVNVCYQSLWDSEQGAHLTVMPDQKTGEVTLLDYPKFKDLENLASDDELQDFCADMEEYYYYTIYNADNSSNNEMRQEFADIFDAYITGQTEVTLADGETILGRENMQTAMDERYGPWINPVYCSGAWMEYRSQSGGADTSRGTIVDSLFAPMVVEAAYQGGYQDVGGNPIPYFEKYPYNFMDNYQNWLTMKPEDYNSLNDYQQVPQKVWDFINATVDIYVPAGVDSIDVHSYKDKNPDNYNTYITDRTVNAMHTSTLNGAQPGLFSGYYQDYEEDDKREIAVRGNDTIQSVTLTSVKELPDYAFDNCEQLTRVEMPAVTRVGKLPFRDCANMINLVGSPDYPAERGILYERHKDADGNDRYRIIECLLSRGRDGSGEELMNSRISPAEDSLLPFLCETCDTDKNGSNVLPAIAEGAFEGCKDISFVDLSNANNLKTIPKDAFKDCTGLNQVLLPGSVNKIADNAFARTDDTVNASLATVTIYGREVDIADSAFTPRRDFTIYSYEDSAAERYAKRFQIPFYPLDAYRVWFYDYDGTPLGDMMTVVKGFVFKEDDIPSAAKVVEEKNHRPGYKFDGWLSNTGKTPSDGIENDMTIFVAQYKSDGTLVDGKCSVQFVHGRTGKELIGYGADETTGKYMIIPNTSFNDPVNATPSGRILEPPVADPDPTDDGYVFMNEYRTDQGEVWTPDTPINRNMTVLALFGKTGDGTTSGGSTNTSNGSTSGNSGNTSGNSSNSSRNSSNSSSNRSSSSSSSSTSSSSTSSTSNISGAGQYTVFVENGSGSGSYAPGTIVIISAFPPAQGMVFSNWTTDSNGVTLASTTMSSTTFTMPANNVTVKANYVAGTATSPASVNGNGNGSTTNDNGNTRVDIEKPGISNRDLASAVTNGSSDNFIVKISETDEATRAVAAALTNKYGTLDNILYYAMDITLWDSTGTHQITGDQLNGISVDITIPIPDSLVAYGGNNMAGAVVSGDQLESLNESFTTINGVPCIRFRATHFSPYTIYVDTGNLVEGMLDVTPKTGDPIHPKWFLSLGLACLSIILFLKKDKKVAAKAAVKA